MGEKVVILGASDKESRYSYKAFKLLQEYGHTPILVHPRIKKVEDFDVLPTISSVEEQVDTLTMYVRAEISSKSIDEILNLNPKRVIFNPGTENPEMYPKLKEKGIDYEEACTLVLLRTNQY